jgi:hypothetical protein
MGNRKVWLTLVAAIAVVAVVAVLVVGHLLRDGKPQPPSQSEYEDKTLTRMRSRLRPCDPEEQQMSIGKVPAGRYFFVPPEKLVFATGQRGSALGREGVEAERQQRPLFELHKTKPSVDGILLIGYVGRGDREKLDGPRATVSLYPRRAEDAQSLKVIDLWRIQSAEARQVECEDGKSLQVLVVTVVSVG